MANLKGSLISGSVGGVTGIVTALLIVAIHQHFDGISEGDILQFLGAVVGTGLVIGGVVWVEKTEAQIAEG